jgi:acetyl esterase
LRAKRTSSKIRLSPPEEQQMPLDPTVKALFEQMPQLADFRFWSMTVPEARAAFRGLCQAGSPADIPIGKTEDVEFAGPASTLRVRAYTPVAAGGDALPAIVFIHGGGFVLGDLDCYDPLCRALANESGCRVIAVDYRLAPEHVFPAAVDDCFAALKWVEDNAAALGVDANRIAVAGDSAGGNLAAATVLLAKQKGAPKLAFQLLIYPALSADMNSDSTRNYGQGYFLDLPTIAWFMKHYAPGADPSDPRLIPMSAKDVAGLPPTCIVTSGCDPLRDGGQAYAEKLKAAGVKVTHVDYPTMIHAFFNMPNFLPLSREAIAAAAKAVKDALA